MFFNWVCTIQILIANYSMFFLSKLTLFNVYYFILFYYCQLVYSYVSYWRWVIQLMIRSITPKWQASNYAEFFWYLIAMKNTIYTIRTENHAHYTHYSNFWYFSLIPAYSF